MLRLNSPSWFSRLFNAKSNKQYKISLSHKLSELENVKKAIRLVVGNVEAKQIR